MFHIVQLCLACTVSDLQRVSIDVHVNVDGPYVYIFSCANDQKAHGLQLIGVANRNAVFETFMGLANDSKQNEASFSSISIVSFYF